MSARSWFLDILVLVLGALVVWGSGFTGAAQVRVGGMGQIYVTAGSSIVRVNDMTGAGRTRLGPRVPGTDKVLNPVGIFVDGAGRIYVADLGNQRIVRVNNMTGAGWTTLGTAGPGVGQFHDPWGIFLEGTGRIYVADYGNNRIVRMNDMTGAGWTTLGSWGGGINQFRNPTGVFVDSAGRIYVADLGNHRIIRVNDMTGVGWTTLGTCQQFPCAGVNEFGGPEAIFVDGAGRIYVADGGNRIVRVNDMTGAGWTALGTCPQPPRCTGVNQFSAPFGIFVDGVGRIYVADATSMYEGRLVRMNDMTGAGWTSLDTPGFPRGIFVR